MQHPTTTRRTWRVRVAKPILGVAAAVSLIATGCGSSGDDDASSTTTAPQEEVSTTTEVDETTTTGDVDDTAPEESTPTEPPDTDGSDDPQMDEAVAMADEYLALHPVGEVGLVEALVGEGFGPDEATRAVEILDPDWNEQAVRYVQNWMDPDQGGGTDLSRQEQVEEMTTYAGFTKAEAEYGLDNWDR